MSEMSKDVNELVRQRIVELRAIRDFLVKNAPTWLFETSINHTINLLSALSQGRDGVLEEAAKWHDQRHRGTPDAFEMEFHAVCAKEIRALKSQPAQPQEDTLEAFAEEQGGRICEHRCVVTEDRRFVCPSCDKPAPPAETPEKAWVEWWVSWVRKEGRDPDMFDLCKEFDRRLSNGGQK